MPRSTPPQHPTHSTPTNLYSPFYKSSRRVPSSKPNLLSYTTIAKSSTPPQLSSKRSLPRILTASTPSTTTATSSTSCLTGPNSPSSPTLPLQPTNSAPKLAALLEITTRSVPSTRKQSCTSDARSHSTAASCLRGRLW